MPTVTFYTVPSDKGSITFNTATYYNGQSDEFLVGGYNALANVPPSYEFVKWSATGGVVCETESGNPTPVTVEDDGTLTAEFRWLPPAYTNTIANLKTFRGNILQDLVASRIIAGLDANHDSMQKYKGVVENLGILPYVFGRVREKALALKFKGIDVDIGMLTKIDAKYTGASGLYPMTPPFSVPQRELPQVDVYLYDTIKDIDLLRQTDMTQVQSFILLQAPSGTFEEAPDAENVFYDYYMIYVQKRRDVVITPSGQETGYAAWQKIRGEETWFIRKLTPAGTVPYTYYHFYILMDAGVYGDTTITATPAVILLHPTFTDTRPLITMSIAGQSILSTTFGIYATPSQTGFPRIIGFQRIAGAWEWDSWEDLWYNEFPVTISVEPEGGGTTDPPVGDYTWQAESSHPITAYPSGGYAFDHWEFDDVNKGAANPITHDTFKKQKVKAVFVPT